MFSFLSNDKPGSIDLRTLRNINDAVHQFLEQREVQNFKVYTIDYSSQPVVLIQAVPQKKLRFSNILEIQIKRHLLEKLGIQIPAVFWRFKIGDSADPGPEQVDYEYEECPESQQENPGTSESPETVLTPDTDPDKPEELSGNVSELYDVGYLARKGMEVEEITMGEFDDFLKGTSNSEPPQP